MQAKSLSYYVYFFCAAVMLYTSFIFSPSWNKTGVHATISWDVSGYYWYLPAIFIYKDVKQCAFGQAIQAKYRPTPQGEQAVYDSVSGNYVMTYSSGMALMYLPFFTVAHIVAKPLGYAADGFSIPYQLALQIGSMLIALIGLWQYRRLMRYYYSDKVVSVLLLLLVIGTNYLNYAAIDSSLTHNWLFTLYAFLLLATRQFYITPTTRLALAIGLLCGLAILIRPSEIICIMLPLLWGIETISITAIRGRITFLLARYKQVLAAAAITIAIGSIQVIYWLYVTGRPLVYSYGDKGFYWTRPHLLDYTLSYRSGWITYTPLMIIAILAFIPFLKYGKNKVAVLLFFAINLYIVSAWDVWWYGGTGGRAMIQSYPIMLFPLATLLQVLSARKVLAWVVSPVIILLAYFNIWFTYNAHAGNGLYDPTGMTKDWYWHVIYRYKVPEDYTKYKDTDELFTGKPRDLKLLYANDFEQDTLAVNRTEPAINGKVSVVLNNTTEYAGNVTFTYTNGKPRWLRAEATFKNIGREWTDWKMPQFIITFKNKDDVVKSGFIRVSRLLEADQTRRLYKDIIIPNEAFDRVSIHLWNPASDETVLMDDLKVYSFDE